MKGLKNILINIICVILFITALTTIFNFIGLEVEKYIIYILWLIALLLFYIFLPVSTGNMFNDSN
mgnify:FL=1|tara:strand:+ start:151 stop:345 length:195 start_codon:yes stop_codon:yes gene_type:complete